MSVNEIILNYRNFLLSSWTCLSEILTDLDWDEFPYFLDDWMQANWELLVEKQINPNYTLASYGFDSSPLCRYSDKNRSLSHKIFCCEKKNPSEIKYIFLSFTAEKNGVYQSIPPFDYVNVENFVTKERLALPLNTVNFTIGEV